MSNYEYTLEDRIESLKESIILGAIEDFDMNYSMEELDELIENDYDHYMDMVYDQEIGAIGYEGLKLTDLDKLSNEDIIKIYNFFHNTHLTMEYFKECF